MLEACLSYACVVSSEHSERYPGAASRLRYFVPARSSSRESTEVNVLRTPRRVKHNQKSPSPADGETRTEGPRLGFKTVISREWRHPLECPWPLNYTTGQQSNTRWPTVCQDLGIWLTLERPQPPKKLLLVLNFFFPCRGGGDTDTTPGQR